MCVSEKYDNRDAGIEIEHTTCGTRFNTKWMTVYERLSMRKPKANGAGCPHCDGKPLESAHAMVLKQVFLRLVEGCVLEDKSCRNPRTGRPLPTDIVDYHGKRVIEIQSVYHDREDQKVKDEVKKRFWLSNGFAYFNPDIREYAVLEMIQLFFPQITSIPEWIDYRYSNRLNDKEAQRLLDSGLNSTEVAHKMGVSPTRIYNAYQVGRILYPDEHVPACYVPVVQFDLDGNLLAKYKSTTEAARESGIPMWNIRGALVNGRNHSGGYLWMYLDEYERHGAQLNKGNSDAHRPIKQMSMDGDTIRVFNSATEASKNTSIATGNITSAAKGKRKSIGGYKWEFVA